MAIGKKLIKIFIKNKRFGIVAASFFGSIASGREKKYSDIDLIFISKTKQKDIFFILKQSRGFNGIKIGTDIKISIFFFTVNDSLQIIRSINHLEWPVRVAILLNTLPVYDPKKLFDRFQNEYSNILKLDGIDSVFLKLSGRWLSMSYEFLGKILNTDPSDCDNISVVVALFARSITNSLVSLNKKYFLDAYDLVGTVIKLDKTAKGTAESIRCLLKETKIESVKIRASKLWHTTYRFMRKSGVELPVIAGNRFGDLKKYF